MREVVLTSRLNTGDEGTFGVLKTKGFACCVGELPWRDNRQKLSHILPGTYEVSQVKSPHFGLIYGIHGTPGRSHVLIHSGNFCGDVTKGYQSHVEGCLILGKVVGTIKNKYGNPQKAVLISMPTVRAFTSHMGGEPFKLIVENLY